MQNLVFVENGQVVTDSLKVAEVFGKEHRRVLQDIRTLDCSESFRQHNFVQSYYLNNQNKEMPMFYLNRKGFTLLAFSYTGKEATKFKESYIEQFEMMEEKLRKPRVLTEKEQLVASMKLSIETSEELSIVKNEVAELKVKVQNKITLDHGEQQALNHAIKKRIESIANDFEEQMSKQKLYSQIHSHLRRAFAAPSYRVVKQKDYQEAIAWVKAWRPLI